MKMAGIDVHKKVLIVVVIETTSPEEKPERRRFTTLPGAEPIVQLVASARCASSGHGIHGGRCGWNWSRICSCLWPMPSPTVHHGEANMTLKMRSGWCDGCSLTS